MVLLWRSPATICCHCWTPHCSCKTFSCCSKSKLVKICLFVYEQQVRIELWKFGAYITLRMCECGALSTEAWRLSLEPWNCLGLGRWHAMHDDHMWVLVLCCTLSIGCLQNGQAVSLLSFDTPYSTTAGLPRFSRILSTHQYLTLNMFETIRTTCT